MNFIGCARHKNRVVRYEEYIILLHYRFELKNYCTWVKATVNNVDGYYVTGKNGNRIFIPNGSYWSNTLSTGLNNAASCLGVYYNIVTYLPL